MSKFAIVVGPNSDIYETEQLANNEVAVTIFNGSHFTTLKMLEGFLRKDEIRVVNSGTMRERFEAVGRGEVAAATFNEPWITCGPETGLSHHHREPLHPQRSRWQ